MDKKIFRLKHYANVYNDYVRYSNLYYNGDLSNNNHYWHCIIKK